MLRHSSPLSTPVRVRKFSGNKDPRQSIHPKKLFLKKLVADLSQFADESADRTSRISVGEAVAY